MLDDQTQGAPDDLRGVRTELLAAYQYKDLRIAMDSGAAYGAPMPITEVTIEFYKSMTETGMARDDNSGITQVLERFAGTEARIDTSKRTPMRPRAGPAVDRQGVSGEVMYST